MEAPLKVTLNVFGEEKTFHARNATEMMKQLGCSRTTLRRALKGTPCRIMVPILSIEKETPVQTTTSEQQRIAETLLALLMEKGLLSETAVSALRNFVQNDDFKVDKCVQTTRCEG